MSRRSLIKGSVGLIAAPAIIGLFPRGASASTTWYVATTGSDTTGNGTDNNPYATINQAGSVANPGDTVLVLSGTYSETSAGNFYTSYHGITYKSAVRWGAKIVPSATTYTKVAFEIDQGNNCVVDGFDIDGSGPNAGMWAGGIISTGSNTIIRNCRVCNIATAWPAATNPDGGAGIEIDGYYGGTGGLITNCVVGNVGVAGRAFIRHCLYLSAYGVCCENNILYKALDGYGINCWHGASHLIISNNLIFNCLGGIINGSGEITPGGQYYTRGNDFTMIFNNIVINGFTGSGSPVVGIYEYVNRSSGGSLGTHNQYSNNCVLGMDTPWIMVNGTHVNDVNVLPTFVNYRADGSGDYHSVAGSSAIGAGIASLGGNSAPSVDLDGRSRSVPACDLGPYQFVP
jgi:hypothetical protein